MSFDTVVIGGGISGLAAALILARHGRRVAVVEQAPRLAPLVGGFRRRGVYFDSGFHYTGGLGAGEVLDLLFRYLGLGGRIRRVPLDPAGFDLFRDAGTGKEFSFPCGLGALREALCEAFPDEAAGIGAYLSDLVQACRSLPYLNPDAEAADWNVNATLQGPSLAEVLGRRFRDAELRRLLSLHTLLHGVAPAEVAFALHAAVTVPYYGSAHCVAGGGQALAAALTACSESAGVAALVGRRAERLLFSSAGHLSGVQLADGEPVACRECVVSLHPQRFLALVPEGLLRPAYRKRLLGLKETVSGALLFLHGDTPPRLLENANLYLGPSGPGEEGSTLFVSGTRSDPAAPEPCGWTLICPARWKEPAEGFPERRGGRSGGYRAAKQEMVERLLLRLQREAPEIVRDARVVEAATPLTVRDYCGGPAGGLYGVSHSIGQYNPQAATRIPHLYLCGQATAAPGVMGAVISAFLACGQILGQDRLRAEVMSGR
jgi:all-trans-retinol 13,14-reductase